MKKQKLEMYKTFKQIYPKSEENTPLLLVKTILRFIQMETFIHKKQTNSI